MAIDKKVIVGETTDEKMTLAKFASLIRKEVDVDNIVPRGQMILIRRELTVPFSVYSIGNFSNGKVSEVGQFLSENLKNSKFYVESYGEKVENIEIGKQVIIDIDNLINVKPLSLKSNPREFLKIARYADRLSHTDRVSLMKTNKDIVAIDYILFPTYSILAYYE